MAKAPSRTVSIHSSKQPVVNKIPKLVTDLPFCEDVGQHQPASDLIFFLFCFALLLDDYKRSLMPAWQICNEKENSHWPD